MAASGKALAPVRSWPSHAARPLDEIAQAADVPRRKTRIVLTLLKRQGMMREHRGGLWERLGDDVATADLSRELLDYEERRRRDREKLDEMVRYCRTARCRTRLILEYFGEAVDEEARCGHCDNCRTPVRDAGERDRVRVPLAHVPAEAEIAFAPGDEVHHGTFGEGMVTAADGDRVEVDFSGHGTRTVRAEFLRPVM